MFIFKGDYTLKARNGMSPLLETQICLIRKRLCGNLLLSKWDFWNGLFEWENYLQTQVT